MAEILTEEDAVFAYAKAWNRLNPEDFLELLTEDTRYTSQWVFEELKGSQAISDYLRDKMRTVRAHGVNNHNIRVRVEIGRTSSGSEGRPCAFMTQGREGEGTVQAAVIFSVSGNRITRYDLCIPQLLSAIRTGVYPI